LREALVLFGVLALATGGLVHEVLARTVGAHLLAGAPARLPGVVATWLASAAAGLLVGGRLGRARAGGRGRARLRDRDPAAAFVRATGLAGAVGGGSAALVAAAFPVLEPPALRALLLGLAATLGALVGIEVALAACVARRRYGLDGLAAQALHLDSVAALALVALPYAILPRLGLVHSAAVLGAVVVGVAAWATFLLRDALRRPALERALCALALAVLGAGHALAGGLDRAREERGFGAPVVLARDLDAGGGGGGGGGDGGDGDDGVRDGAIRLTSRAGDVRLHIGGALRASSRDGGRYHEALVHPALSLHPRPRRVLVIGGGDGLAVQEVLKHGPVERVLVVAGGEREAAVARAFATVPPLVALNGGALRAPRVSVEAADPLSWVEDSRETFDVAILDVPDPDDAVRARVYTRPFYRALARRLGGPGPGLLATPASSPFHTPRTFSSIANTLASAGFDVRPYRAHVPSLGERGFVLAGAGGRAPPEPIALRPGLGLRSLDDATLADLFRLPADTPLLATRINRLDDPVVVHHHDEEWAAWE